MKRIGKVFIIAGSLLFVGIILILTGLGLLARDKSSREYSMDDTTVEYETKTYQAEAEELNKLVIDLVSEKIRLEPSDGDAIEIEYMDVVGEPQYVISNQDGVLTISYERASNQWISIPPVLEELGFPFEADTNSLQMNTSQMVGEFLIRVPADFEGAYEISLVSGDVAMQNLTVGGALTMDSVSGNIRLENLVCMENVQTDLVSATLEAREVIANAVYVNTVSGNADMEELTIEEGIVFDSTSGSLCVTLTDAMEEYSVLSDTVSGDINIPNMQGEGKKTIRIDTVSGNAEVVFTKSGNTGHDMKNEHK